MGPMDRAIHLQIALEQDEKTSISTFLIAPDFTTCTMLFLKNWKVKVGKFHEFAKFAKVFLRQSFALYGIPYNESPSQGANFHKFHEWPHEL